MKIEKIEKLKNGKYKIHLDTKDEIITYDDVILKEELLFAKELDFSDLKQIRLATVYAEVYQKMVHKISTKYRSMKEIKEELKKFDITEKERNEIVDKLKEVGLINDERFMKAYISDRMHLSTDGPYLIYKNLENYGIDDTLLASFDSYIDEELVQNKIKDYICKKIKSNKKYSIYILKQKIVETLSLKGYHKSDISHIFDSFSISDNSSLKKEYQKQYEKLSKKYEGRELYFNLKQKLYAKGFTMVEIERCVQEENL